MIELYSRVACPHCAKVKAFLELHQIDFIVRQQPKLKTERKVFQLTGDGAVPLLIDGDDVMIQGSGKIIEYLEGKVKKNVFNDPSYGLTKRFKGCQIDPIIEQVRLVLKAEGFGVLTEIDVKKTLKAKIDKDFRPYVILGACNPHFAYEALMAESGLGLLLPCNVVVSQEEDDVIVSMIDPLKMFSILDNKDLVPLADEVREKLIRAMGAIHL